VTEPGSEAAVLRAAVEVGLEPAAAFDVIVDELPTALARLGIDLELRPDGIAREGDVEVGRVVTWQPGERLVLEWRATTWAPEQWTKVTFGFARVGATTRIEIEQRGWERAVGEPGELAGWFAGQVAAPLLRATAPGAFGEWFTDRHARRPSGEHARAVYRDPLFHRPNFAVMLELLALGPEDVLLEVGCGGGAFLHEALESGCHAAAVDHSPDMVRLARETNAQAVAERRLEVIEASADRLPFPDEMFTAAAVTGVLGFLTDPVAVLAQIRRVLADGGRLVMLGSDPAWRGTPAAPEPMASRLRFYEDDELVHLAHAAAFSDARVLRRNLEEPAREAGVPDEHLSLFAEGTAPFLVARKPA
jgi:ubiquinone/menaquinone biosynthesis C-methylase UbiE